MPTTIPEPTLKSSITLLQELSSQAEAHSGKHNDEYQAFLDKAPEEKTNRQVDVYCKQQRAMQQNYKDALDNLTAWLSYLESYQRALDEAIKTKPKLATDIRIYITTFNITLEAIFSQSDNQFEKLLAKLSLPLGLAKKLRQIRINTQSFITLGLTFAGPIGIGSLLLAIAITSAGASTVVNPIAAGIVAAICLGIGLAIIGSLIYNSIMTSHNKSNRSTNFSFNQAEKSAAEILSNNLSEETQTKSGHTSTMLETLKLTAGFLRSQSIFADNTQGSVVGPERRSEPTTPGFVGMTPRGSRIYDC